MAYILTTNWKLRKQIEAGIQANEQYRSRHKIYKRVGIPLTGDAQEYIQQLVDMGVSSSMAVVLVSRCGVIDMIDDNPYQSPTITDIRNFGKLLRSNNMYLSEYEIIVEQFEYLYQGDYWVIFWNQLEQYWVADCYPF